MLRGYSLLPGQAEQLSGIPSGAVLRLQSEELVCYSLSVGRCDGGEGEEGERVVRDAQGAERGEGGHSEFVLLLIGRAGH